MKLDYFTLLSPHPIRLNGVGSIKSPKLSEISEIGYGMYNIYTTILSMDIDGYYDMIDETGDEYFSSIPPQYKNSIIRTKQFYQNLDIERQKQFTIMDVTFIDPVFTNSILQALNFFMVEEVIPDEENKIFRVYDGSIDENDKKRITGIIHTKNYQLVTDLILERLNIDRKDVSPKKNKFKNKLAEDMFKKQNKANTISKKSNKKFEIPNLISSLASHHNSLNMINIWDLTVYQLYDQFNRVRLNDWDKIHSTTVSVWGDKDKKFDGAEWMTLINEN